MLATLKVHRKGHFSIQQIDALIVLAERRSDDTPCSSGNASRSLRCLRLGRFAMKADGYNTDKIDGWIAEAEAEERKTEDANRG